MCGTVCLRRMCTEDYKAQKVVSRRPVRVCVCVCVCVCMQGLDPAVLECLPDWQFDNTRVVIRLDSNLTPTDQVTALRTTLQQLQAMQKAPGSAGVVELAGLPETPAGWRPGLIGMLCAAVPDLPHLHLSVRRSSNISDQVLGGLVQTGQGVRYVSACDLSLASEQHAGAQWPWRELRFSGVLHVPGLVRVPRPSGQGGPSVVGCNDLMFQGVAEQVRCYTHAHVSTPVITYFKNVSSVVINCHFHAWVCVCVCVCNRMQYGLQAPACYIAMP